VTAISTRGEDSKTSKSRYTRLQIDEYIRGNTMKRANNRFAETLMRRAIRSAFGSTVSILGVASLGLAVAPSAFAQSNATGGIYGTVTNAAGKSLVLAQKGNLRKVSETIADPDLAKAVLALRLGIIFMHARINPDEVDIKLRMRQRIDLELPKGTLSTHPTLAYWLGKEQASWEELGIEFLVRPLV
jgi:hypothetical protein